jgi:hypothetical protein
VVSGQRVRTLSLARGTAFKPQLRPALADVLQTLRPLCEITWEVDEFLGANQGLIIAEVELQSEDQCFVRGDYPIRDCLRIRPAANSPI